MNWYLAKLVFSIDVNDATIYSEFDEQYRLIQANDQGQAYRKAKNLGQKLQTSFYNVNNVLVNWRFIDACEIHLINDLSDEAELYSNTLEVEDKTTFIDLVLQKAITIQAKNLTFY